MSGMIDLVRVGHTTVSVSGWSLAFTLLLWVLWTAAYANRPVFITAPEQKDSE